jgi:hypothetical protein
MKAAYFPHDYNARTDPKLQEVIMTHGMAGIGVYWCIVEMMYEQGGRLPTKSINSIAYNLHTSADIVRSIIYDFELFVVEGDEFMSNAVKSRIVKKEEISAMKQKAAMARWGKPNAMQMQCKCNADAQKNDADAMQAECRCNAIYKENKNKENIKEKDKKEKASSSSLPLDEEIEDVKADNTWIDHICMNHHIIPAKLFTMLGDFKAECIANGIERHRNIADVKSHINNWLRIQVYNKKKNKRNDDSNTNKRRGLDVSDDADYSGEHF